MDAKFVTAATIAREQSGRISTEQLAECGLGKSSIEKGVRAGRLHRVHEGVFALGHLAPSRLGDWHGAVLACGPDAVLSIRCAATALKIREGVGPTIDVTIPPGSGRRRPGIAIHRAPLPAFEVGTWSNIPITSPSRTMVDLAHHLKDAEQIEWAMRQLQFQKLFDHKLLELANQRRPNRHITRLLNGFEPTLSPLEIAFLTRVVRRHNLPAPTVNTRVEGFLADFHWPEARLIVETDGKQHDQPLQRAADAHRDAIHEAAGYLVLRYRWTDVHVHHERTAARIAAELSRRGGRCGGTGWSCPGTCSCPAGCTPEPGAGRPGSRAG
jgi:very-short-patch-repair endonuclease